jgi:hypothetical protein
VTWLQRLFRRLTSRFSLDPQAFLALRLQCDGTDLTWTVSEGVLTTAPIGGTAAPLTIDLSQYTVAQLVSFLNASQGYAVIYQDSSALAFLSALVLLDASGDVNTNNGDHIYGYQSILYARLSAWGAELKTAEAQIPQLPLEMSTTTAAGIFLDNLGNQFNVPRIAGEADPNYGPRIILETLMPKDNNMSMALALQTYTGQPFTVTDVTTFSPVEPLHNGVILHNGAHYHNAQPIISYGLFDVEGGYDLIQGTTLTDLQTVVLGLIDRLRAEGTHLRNLVLAPLSNLVDTVTIPSDDTDTLDTTYTYTHNGQFLRNGQMIHAGGDTLYETIPGLLLGIVSNTNEVYLSTGGLVLSTSEVRLLGTGGGVVLVTGAGVPLGSVGTALLTGNVPA